MAKIGTRFVVFFSFLLVVGIQSSNANYVEKSLVSPDLSPASVEFSLGPIRMSNSEGPVTMTVKVVQGEAASQRELLKKLSQIGQKDEVILVSDLSEKGIAEALGSYSFSEPLIKAEKSLAFLDIQNEISSYEDKQRERKAMRKEKIEAVAFATLQTGLATYSFICLSGIPFEPAVVSSLISGFLNFYFSWDVTRWDRFLRWGRSQFANLMKVVGVQQATEAVWFGKATKSATGFISRIGFNALFTGIGMWSSFSSQFFTISTGQTVFINSTIGFAMTQPFDTTLGDWLEYGHWKFSEEQVKIFIRFRTLVAAAIAPLLYASHSFAPVAAGAMFAGGVVVTLYDQWGIPKKSRKPAQKFFPTCQTIFGRS